MRLMAGRADEAVRAEDLVRVRDFLQLLFLDMTAVAYARLIDLHRRAPHRMRVMAVGAIDARQVMRRALPLAHVRVPLVARETHVFPRRVTDVTVRLVTRRAIERAGPMSGPRRIGRADTMRVRALFEALHFTMAPVTRLRRDRAQIM